MKNAFRAAILSATVLSAVSAFAAPASKTYQVTGPVLEVTDTTITVEKGKEKWTIARDPSTQVTGGELKPGEKVTITYKMVAADVEVKGGKTTGKTDTKKTETTTTTTTTETKK